MDQIGGLPWHSRFFALVMACCLAAYGLLLVDLARARKPWNDEAMSASAGYTLATKGYMAIPSFDEANPGMSGIQHHMYYIFPLQMMVMAAWYKIVGFGLLSTRVLSMVWAVLGGFALYKIMKLLSANAWVALLAVALTACDYQVASAAAFGRYDMMVAALGFCGYASFLLFRERNLAVAMLAANTCVAAAGMTHPNGIVYFLGLWFLIFYYDRRRIKVQYVALSAIPYLVGGAAWAWYILQDLHDFKIQLSGNSSNRVGLLHPWQTLMNELEFRYIRPYGLGPHAPGHGSALIRLKSIALLGYAAGVIGCLAIPGIRKHPGYRVLILLSGIHFLFFTFYEGMKFNYYLVHLAPFYLCLLAVFVSYCWSVRPALRPLLACGVALMIGVGAGGALMRIRINEMRNSYDPAVAFLKQTASKDDVVFATCSFGFGYGFSPSLVDDDSFGYFSKRQARFIVMEEIYDDSMNLYRALHPKIYAHIMELMPGYHLVYDRADYRIYEKIPESAQLAAAKN
jgi:4-amino-4-deoxy-L-arabinose transferase-like glycosyltransferase